MKTIINYTNRREKDFMTFTCFFKSPRLKIHDRMRKKTTNLGGRIQSYFSRFFSKNDFFLF